MEKNITTNPVAAVINEISPVQQIYLDVVQKEECKEYVKKWEIEQAEKILKRNFLHVLGNEIIKPKGYYVYFHITTGLYAEVFYVGMGQSNRAFDYYSRSKEWKDFVGGKSYQVFIFRDNLTQQEAFDVERKYIKKIGRKDLNEGMLVNKSNGSSADSCYP